MELYGNTLLKERVENLLKDGEDFLNKALQECGITESQLRELLNSTDSSSKVYLN